MMRQLLANETGASAVEMAVLVPLLVLLLFGLVEFGLLLYNQQVITNASREGARAAIVGHCAGGTETSIRKTDAEIAQIVTDYCIDPNDPTKRRLITFAEVNNPPVTTVSPSPSDCTPGGAGLTVGDDVTVAVQYTYTFLVPSLLGFGATKQMEARTVMKMESAP